MEKLLVRTDTAAKMLGVPPSEVQRYIQIGLLKTVGGSRALRVRVDSINELAAWKSKPLAEQPPQGHVYVLRSGVRYKIGISKNFAKRISGINTSLPEPAEVVHIIPTNNMRKAEAMLHSQFQSCRSNGEWFELSADDIAMIRQCEALMFM